MSLLKKARQNLEEATRWLQDAYVRVHTATTSPTYPFGLTGGRYDVQDLERELQLFCHRARIHHRARYMAMRAAILEPPDPIVIAREEAQGQVLGLELLDRVNAYLAFPFTADDDDNDS